MPKHPHTGLHPRKDVTSGFPEHRDEYEHEQHQTKGFHSRTSMYDPKTSWLVGVAISFALANVPLLILLPSGAEQRLWRNVGVERLRRWITSKRNPGRTLCRT